MALKREQVIQNAERYVSRGRIDAAIREYRKVLGENPNDTNTLNRVGDLYARLDRVDEAIRLFTQIAAHYTTDGFFVKAIAIYKKIIKLDPTQLEVYEKLAELYYRQGLLNEARTQYQVLADYYLKHDNAASAINIHQRMAEMEPDNPSHHVKLAELYQQQSLLDKAMSEYRAIAEVLLGHGHADEARKVFLRGLDLDHRDLDFVGAAVKALREAGQAGHAAHFLDAAVERNPAAASLRSLLAGYLVEPARPAPRTPPAPPVAGPEDTLADEVAAASGAEEPAVADGGDDLFLDLDRDLEIPAELRGGEAEAEAEAVTPTAAPSEMRGFEEDIAIELDLEALEQEMALEAPAPGEPGPGEELELGPAEDLELELGPAEELELEEQPTLEVDLSELDLGQEVDLEEPAEEEPAGAPTPESPAEIEWAFEAAEAPPAERPPAAEPPAPTPMRPEQREQSLLAEAEVFAKYDLEDKAFDRLREVLHLNPRNAEALGQLASLHLRSGHVDRVVTSSNQLAELARQTGAEEQWERLRQRLAKAGYRVEGRTVVSGPPRAEPREDRISKLLDSLVEEPERRAKAPRRAEPELPAAIEDALAALRPGAERRKTKRPPRPAAAPPPPTARPGEPPPAATPELPFAEAPATEEPELEGFTLPVEREAAAPFEAPEAAAADGAAGVDWLDELAAAGAGEEAGAGGGLFAEEEEFFDLAAELEEELRQEELAAPLASEPEEQSLEEIVEGFKRGVAETLSPEDFDTHFNLGIAYREMGLLDEAIGEFQLAAKDPRYLVDCCSLLGLCFVDKGLPELAIKWYRRGLESPGITEDATLGLLYDMGSIYAAIGDADAAYKTFVEVYGTNSNYRDVVARLEELGHPHM